MKNIKLKFGFIFLIMAIVCSCEPRIELDMGQWGNRAYITNVELIKLEIREDFRLAEWHTDDAQIPVAGVRRIIISLGSAVINDDNFTATVRLREGESLEEAGILIYHYGTLVEQLGNAPTPGIVNNLSARSFEYRVHSADGNYNDWIINIE